MPKEAHTGTYYRTASIQKTLPDEKKNEFSVEEERGKTATGKTLRGTEIFNGTSKINGNNQCLEVEDLYKL